MNVTLWQRSNDKPHPTENILALTPESDTSIAVIGYAQDLGRCRAMKRDNTRCTSWCDKRVSDVCEFHIQTAVQRARASRPEFSVGCAIARVSLMAPLLTGDGTGRAACRRLRRRSQITILLVSGA